MNRYFYTLIISICFLGRSIAQEVPLDAKEQAKTTLNDYELTDKQYAAWRSIKNNWIVSDYEVIESENKIKMNCKN